jgi:hypothetical protein
VIPTGPPGGVRPLGAIMLPSEYQTVMDTILPDPESSYGEKKKAIAAMM